MPNEEIHDPDVSIPADGSVIVEEDGGCVRLSGQRRNQQPTAPNSQRRQTPQCPENGAKGTSGAEGESKAGKGAEGRPENRTNKRNASLVR